jgi:hypothetical protein
MCSYLGGRMTKCSFSRGISNKAAGWVSHTLSAFLHTHTHTNWKQTNTHTLYTCALYKEMKPYTLMCSEYRLCDTCERMHMSTASRRPQANQSQHTYTLTTSIALSSQSKTTCNHMCVYEFMQIVCIICLYAYMYKICLCLCV